MADTRVRRQVVDTSKTDPASFLSGASAPPLDAAPQAPVAVPPEVQAAGEEAQTAVSAPVPEVAPAPPAPIEPDPFQILARWSSKNVARTLRAMDVPGGCLVKSSYAIAPNVVPSGESLCFVPNVSVVDGKLAKSDA